MICNCSCIVVGLTADIVITTRMQDLYFRINELKDAESARQASSESTASSLFNKFSSTMKRESITTLSGHGHGAPAPVLEPSNATTTPAANEEVSAVVAPSTASVALSSASAAIGNLFRKNSVSSNNFNTSGGTA